MSSDRKLYIGCSGYYYSNWKNSFYPEKLPAARWLEHYATVFDAVELNSTFYRKPQLSALKRYARMTPDGFVFAVKMSRYITHILKMRNCSQPVKELQDLVYDGLENKLGSFLFQFPASYRYGAENLECILASVPHDSRNAVEFRHASWWNDDVRDQLGKNNITMCNADYPGLESKVWSVTDTFYLRMHGNPDLFKSTYQPETLRKYAKAVPANAKKYFVFFNNTYYDGAYINAAQMIAIMKRKKIFQHA